MTADEFFPGRENKVRWLGAVTSATWVVSDVCSRSFAKEGLE